MKAFYYETLLSFGRRVIDSVMQEGHDVGKDDGDIPQWKTEDAEHHATRAHAHLEKWLWGKDENDAERHLEHAVVRALMALATRAEGGESVEWFNY